MRHDLPCGRVTMVDDEDAHLLKFACWRARRSQRREERYYVQAVRYGHSLYLHRLIMGEPDSLSVDHRDGNGLDNRRANLRIGSTGHNNANRSYPPSKTGFRGVEFLQGRYRAHISGGPKTTRNRKKISLGYFDTALQAARAYDLAAIERWGEFARLNFQQQRAA